MQQKLIYESADASVDPDEYLIGAGDRMFLSISGLEEIQLNLRINQDGILYIPKVGTVDINKTTLAEARNIIINAVNRYYRDVDVFVSLVNIKKIKVSLLGDVKKPASFVIPGNARLMDLISSSNGLNKTSDYRNIKIVAKDDTEKLYDLLSFIRLGDRSNNPILNDGDNIIVDKVDKTININGEVKFPGIYEFVANESVSDFIKVCGGLLNEAKKDSIEIVSFLSDGKTQESKYISYEELLKEEILLQNKDRILIREIPDYFDPKYVEVNGYVKYPGFYKIIENKTTLTDIINQAGGFRDEASIADASLTRTTGSVEEDPEFERLKQLQRADMTDDEYDYLKAKSRQRKGRVIIDFVNLFVRSDTTENLIMKEGDEILIPEAKNYVILLGQVVNPGNIVYSPELNVDDYIRLAGGFGWRAEEGDVRVVKANTGEWVDADDVDSLDPGDTIWIPETPPGPKFWDVFTTSLAVLGQVASIIAATVAVIVASR